MDHEIKLILALMRVMQADIDEAKVALINAAGVQEQMLTTLNAINTNLSELLKCVRDEAVGIEVQPGQPTTH